MSKINNLRKYKDYSIYVFIAFFFIICLSFLKDFGVTLDDEIYYLNGLNTYNYVKNFLLGVTNSEINVDAYRDKLKEWPIIFEFFLVFLSEVFGIKPINKIYLFSHQINFFIFCLSLIFFYKLINKRYNNFLFSFISIIFIILSPRIFGESFFNSRDIFFMSLFIFYIYFGYILLEKKNIKNIIIFSIFTALLLNTKILGLIPILLFLFFYIYNFLNTSKKISKEKNVIYLFILCTVISIYVFWPYLWNNPIVNLYLAFKNILEVHENLLVINLYFGNYIQSDLMPWHYRIVWFFITTPLIIILLFLIGSIFQCTKIPEILSKTLNKNYNMNTRQFYDLYLFFCLIFTFLTIAELNTSKFGGWRHLYFLYPIVIYFTIFGLSFLKDKFNKKYFVIISLLIFINMTYNILWMFKNHPNQYLYFNNLKKNYFVKNFDLDWWGLSHKSVLDHILKNDNSDKIHVYAKGFTSLRNTYLFLSEENKSRIVLSEMSKADYIIDNKMKRVRDYNDLNYKEFLKFYVVKVDDQPITEVYKRINKF